jgi:excisionase family DNA binding protein
MTLQELPPTITVEQAGKVLGMSRRTAYRAASTGQLPTFKVGRRLLVPTARLLDLLGLPNESLDCGRTVGGAGFALRARGCLTGPLSVRLT